MTRAEFAALVDEAQQASRDAGYYDGVMGALYERRQAEKEATDARAVLLIAWDVHVTPPACGSCNADETSTVYQCEHCGHSWAVPDEDRTAEMARRAE